MALNVATNRIRRRRHPGEPGSTVQALDRGLGLLAVLARAGRATLTEVALGAGMAPSTAHRMLNTMERHRITEFDEVSQRWMVGVEAFRIGASFMRNSDLVVAARTVMADLMEDTGETVNMAIADQGDVVFLSQVETRNPIRAYFRPGMRGHMHASGIGKSLLAELPRREVEAILAEKGLPAFTPQTLTSPAALIESLHEARSRGWALEDEERTTGMRCLAAPVFNEHGEPVAGISISGPAVRLADARLPELGARVRRAADAITERTGGRAPERSD